MLPLDHCRTGDALIGACGERLAVAAMADASPGDLDKFCSDVLAELGRSACAPQLVDDVLTASCSEARRLLSDSALDSGEYTDALRRLDVLCARLRELPRPAHAATMTSIAIDDLRHTGAPGEPNLRP